MTPTARRYGYALFAMARPGFLLGSVPLYLVGVAALLPVLAGYARYAPAAARGSVEAAERVGLLSVAALGWASASAAALLLVG